MVLGQQDIEHLTQSMETLAAVVEKFARGRESLSAMKPENEGRKCLVPITDSVCLLVPSTHHTAQRGSKHHTNKQLFVEATLEHTDTVLVDVGAQHYVTKVC